jgi:protein TonB
MQMSNINKITKLLSILLVVLSLHALVFWQVMQHTPEKRIVQPSIPIMVSLITPPKPSPVIKPLPVKIPVLLPVAKKIRIKKTEPKTIVKHKRKLTKRVKKPKKVKRKRARTAKRQKTKRVKRKRARTVKQPRRTAKSSWRSKQVIQKKVATTPKRSARSTTVKKATSSSHGYQVRKNSRKSRQENFARKNRRKKVSGTTTAPSYKAAYLHNPYPPYPRISRRRGEQGKVSLRVKVAKNGKATSVTIKRSSGSRRLDQTARKAVNKWRFIPAKINGKIVSGWVIVPIVFKLN